MRKGKIIRKRLINILILTMILIIVVSAYKNIRNSRAEEQENVNMISDNGSGNSENNTSQNTTDDNSNSDSSCDNSQT